MALAGKKLGLLVSAPPNHPNFHHGLQLAQAALNEGLRVYLYCIDQAVTGLSDPRLQSLKPAGLNLSACAFAAERYGVPLNDLATFSGLGALSGIITATDRFICLNAATTP